MLELTAEFISDAAIAAAAKSATGEQKERLEQAAMKARRRPQTHQLSGQAVSVATSPMGYTYRLREHVRTEGLCLWRQVFLKDVQTTWPISRGNLNPVPRQEHAPCDVDWSPILTEHNVVIDVHSHTLEQPMWVKREAEFRIQVAALGDTYFRFTRKCLDYRQVWQNFAGDSPPQRSRGSDESDGRASTSDQMYFDANSGGTLTVTLGTSKTQGCPCS